MEFAHPDRSGQQGLSFVADRFVTPSGSDVARTEVRSPADLDDVVCELPQSLALVDEAVAEARAAAKPFRRLGLEARKALVRAYQARLRVHAEDIARAIAREIGKPLWEARTEVSAMIAKVDVSISEGLRFTQTEVLADLPGEIRYRPHGVAAVIGPFNFPGHLPNGQIVPALLLGNSVVFKPSEKGPVTAAWMARCFAEAGLPRGVVQVVQGDGVVARRLVGHEGVDAVLFTGSVHVGKRILADTAHTPGKLVALELGGKNASIVLDDADVERAAREIAFSAFATAGQRCTATSRVMVHRAVAARLVERLAAAAERAVVGYPFAEGVFAGPVISLEARDRFLLAIEAARAHGFEARAKGGALEVSGRRGGYLRPSVHVAPAAGARAPGYTDSELFGPDLAVHVVNDDAEALALANATSFGLAAAVYTSSADRFEAFADELEVGVVHWNRSSAGASGRLPFGGVKDSGNHRPAGILAGLQCASPVGVYLAPPASSSLPVWPGLDLGLDS